MNWTARLPFGVSCGANAGRGQLVAGRGAYHATRRPEAFSLLELVLVLAIISILSAIAVPRYSQSVARYRVACAAKRIAADLNYARAQARQASQNTTVVFDLAANQLRIPGLADLDHPSTDYVVRVGDEPLRARLVSADFGGDGQVVFTGFGVPDSQGSVVVEVGPYRKTVVLDAASGKASVQ